MTSIGRFVNLPQKNQNWGRFQDEYGNHWNVRSKAIPSGTDSGDELAYRLDFSDASQTLPKVMIEED
ncbi:MAG: hypothetical protein HRU19_10100 [Pseudobacteriovorax sp.]|nr:hypothetical protein [Pseudobacteriovorax sp.]